MQLIPKTSMYNAKPNFAGIRLAKSTNCIKNIETSIDLYEITQKDKAFLKRLRESVNVKELMPSEKITRQEYDRWQEMLNLALDKAASEDRKCVIAATNNKPCGIITYLPGKNKYYIDCICTWPVETGKKVTLAGQTLFKQMFSDFLSGKANIIDLTAILNGPFSTVSKYMKLGFKQIGGENYLVAMRTNRENTKQTMAELNKIITTTPSNEKEQVNLLNKLEL